MNVRFGEGAVRFRISCEELQSLLGGNKLEESLTLAGKEVLLTIDPSGADQVLDLIYDQGRIGLKTSLYSLRALDQEGRQKEGIINNVGGSALSLQVDLKSYSRQKQG